MCIDLIRDISKIFPIRAGELKHLLPFNVRSISVRLSDLGIASLSATLEGRVCFCISPSGDDANEVEMETSPIVKSTTQLSGFGPVEKVSLQIRLPEIRKEQLNLLDNLKMFAHDFLLESVQGDYLFIRGVESTYQCTIEDSITDTRQTTLTIELVNFCGIQPVIFA